MGTLIVVGGHEGGDKGLEGGRVGAEDRCHVGMEIHGDRRSSLGLGFVEQESEK